MKLLRTALIPLGLCTASLPASAHPHVWITYAMTVDFSGEWCEFFLVVFAVAIIGGLGSPIGALGAGMLIGVAESLTMSVVNPAWAPLVAFSVLIVILLRKPVI